MPHLPIGRGFLLAASALGLFACTGTEPSDDANAEVNPVEQTAATEDTAAVPAPITADMATDFAGCMPDGLGTDMEPALTVEGARAFLAGLDAEMSELSTCASQVYWDQATNITPENNRRAAVVGEEFGALSTKLANVAKRFNDVDLPTDLRRQMDGLKRGSNFPAPDKPGAARELAEIMVRLDETYSTGEFELDGQTLTLFEATDIISESRDPARLRAVWNGWRTISPPMRDDYARMVEIINEGARELGYSDAGALWRAGYDMDADDFAAEVDRLWDQIKPLYDQLHCYVRAELNARYGEEVQPATGPIRADLLGNMWAQQWGNIYDIVEPEGAGEGVDLTALLEDADYTPLRMVETGDAFFQSLGFAPLPASFYERSMITKPEGRDVVCHASAWNIDNEEDVRIKMCTKVNDVDFQTVHHEIGHNIYQRAYRDQPIFYKDGANDGFHEAIGDMIALSITPDYLVRIGLLDADDVPGADADLALLMRSALDKIAFMPWGLMVDKWRWQVFDGTLAPETYNEGWWSLREEYQGVAAPGPRPADAFDPGAKYHIPGNTPYMRYFLAHILQFQFHKAACEQAGVEGPLHRCSIYDNAEVGARFDDMLRLGSSQPWPDALEAFTGERTMDGTAMLEYFAPLQAFLEAENADRTCGW